MTNKLFIGGMLAAVMMFFGSASVLAAEDFTEATNLINQKVACDKLSQGQLEKIGDYIMEQMAPGVAHTQMEQIMGGEESESVRQAHIFMARRWYCGDAAGFGMMGMMMSGSGYNYGTGRGFGMMNGLGLTNNTGVTNGWGMMGSGYAGSFGILYFLGVMFFISGIAAFIKYLLKK